MSITEEPKKRLWFKRFLPHSLFGRALLILVTPAVLVQLVALYFFYERHWESVVANMSISLAGEVATYVHEVEHAEESIRVHHQEMARRLMQIHLRYTPPGPLPTVRRDSRFDAFRKQLERHIPYPFVVEQLPDGGDLRIHVALPDMVMVLQVSKKRLISPTTYIFAWWLCGSAVLLTLISVLFLRNQIRPILALASAAEGFGMGRDAPGFRPGGALEVRKAARAFLTMRSRISRQIMARTTMLAGISHDLRTPLTRMRLELALMPETDTTRALSQDVADMQQMIDAYLTYLRSSEETSEPVQQIALDTFVEEVLAPHQRTAGGLLTCGEIPAEWVWIRPFPVRRALDNIISNALRYGRTAHVEAQMGTHHFWISVRDTGGGIPEESFELVFRPFKRLEDSRNLQTGGVGLGLSIARDAIQAQGGDIHLQNLRDETGVVQGLEVRISIPLVQEE